MSYLSTLASEIEKQVNNLETLKVLLEQELHHISSRDSVALVSVLEEKNRVLSSIEQEDETISLCYQKVLTNSESLEEEHLGLMETASQLLKECQYRSAINQKATEQGQLKLQHLRTMLVELRAKESLTYDKSGKTRNGLLSKGVKA